MPRSGIDFNRLLFVFILLLVVGVFSGCAALKGDAPFKEMESSRITSADSMVKNIGQADRAAQREGIVKIDSGAWLVSKPVRITPVDRLPKIFREEVSFNRNIVSLSEFASRVTAITRVRSAVLQDAAKVAATAIAQGSAPLPGAEAQKTAAAATSTSSAGGAARTLHVVYRGSLKGLLDTVSTRLGVHWSYEGETIRFFLTTSRSFVVRAVTGDASLTANVSSSAQGGGSGSSSSTSQAIATSAKLSLWKDVEDGVKAMLSSGGTVTTSLSMGVVTVNDVPEVLDRVGLFIEQVNQELARQIALEVNIYTVALDKSDNFGLDWNAILRSGRLRLSMTPIGLPSDGSSFTLGLLSGDTGTVESSMMFQALSSAGKARRVTTASVVAGNNQPVPVQVGTQTAYISGSNTTMSSNGNTLTTMTVGNLTTGFNLTLLPRILDDNKILLQFTVDLSLLKQIRSFSTTTSRVEMPEVDTRNFLQRVALRSGETLIVSGFEQTIDSANKSGVFDADNVLFGNRKVGGSREVLVITIKPVEIPTKF